MTDSTKQLFDTPWTVVNHMHIVSASGEPVGVSTNTKTAKRLSRLPELYDKLMWAVVQKCPDAFLALDECRICPDKKCKYREIVELLRKVRAGE